jgi:hypothetical protein
MNHLDLATLLQRLAALDAAPIPASPTGRLTAEFFRHNWDHAQPLLRKSPRLRVRPHTSAARAFAFELRVPFKRQRHPDAPIDVAPGPLCGDIVYAPDLFGAPAEQPPVAVLIDRRLGLLHPNYSRRFGVLCLGHLPPGPVPLDALLEHIYGIATYQNVSTSDPADPEAAAWFAHDPDALAGLPAPAPLWEGGVA